MRTIILEQVSVETREWEEVGRCLLCEFIDDNADDLNKFQLAQVSRIGKGETLVWNMGAGGVWRLHCPTDDEIEADVRVHDERQFLAQLAERATGDPTGDQFSRACSALLREARGMAAGFEDIARMGAPSECGRDVVRGANRSAAKALAECGYERPVDFVIEAQFRADHKQVYKTGLFDALDENVVWSGFDYWMEVKREEAGMV